MFNDLILVHRKTAPGQMALSAESFGGAFFWKTCLRQIAIGHSAELEATVDVVEARAGRSEDEVLEGSEAYQFLLQVICGLHSPLLGETEVYGQFKNAVAQHSYQLSPFGSQLQRFFRHLFEDAKKVRQKHLKDLGSQSYGSILRRETRKLGRIHLLGAGHLVQEILPWICKDGKEVHVHCRDVEKASRELGSHPNLMIHSLDDRASLKDAEALVVAAPVSAEWIQEWLPRESSPVLVADLRADSAEDLLLNFSENHSQKSPKVFTLGEFFNLLSQNQAVLEARKNAALAMIDSIVRDRARHVEYRPFGWEDVCA